MYSQKNSKEERSEFKKEKIISIYVFIVTPLCYFVKAGGGGMASVTGAITSAHNGNTFVRLVAILFL